MDDPRRLDLTSDPESSQPDSGRSPRPFLGIRFQCCRTYGRIYRNHSATAYEGRCPKCQARIVVPIGNEGTSNRFFNAN